MLEVDFIFVSLCFQNNLPPALDFLQLPCWDCREFFPFLVHCSFCIQNLHYLRHRNKFVKQIEWVIEVKPLPAMRSSCFVIPLVALWINDTFQPQIVWGIFWDASSSFAATFVVLVRAFLLHGMAAATSLSNFLLAVLRVLLQSWSSRSVK